MRYQTLNFEEFDLNYIQSPDGYLPIWYSIGDDNGPLVLHLDMVCTFRLTDGKVLFLEIPIKTKDELIKVIDYVYTTQQLLNKALSGNFHAICNTDMLSKFDD